jgi:hypothetical protein
MRCILHLSFILALHINQTCLPLSLRLVTRQPWFPVLPRRPPDNQIFGWNSADNDQALSLPDEHTTFSSGRE